MFIKTILNKIAVYFEKPQMIFLLFGLIGGCFFSYYMPMLQTPDEYHHIGYMTTAFGTPELYSEMSESIFLVTNVNSVIAKPEIKIDKKSYLESKNLAFKTRIPITKIRISKRSIWYFPCAIGFYSCYFLGGNMFTCLQMGEFFSVLFYLVLGFFSIKIMPIKKRVLTFWLLAPMTIQQCSSYNYDSVLMPCCFLLSSYILYLKYKEEKIGWKNILLCVALFLIIAIVKLPYILIGGALLTIPIEKFDLKIGPKIDFTLYIKRFYIVIIVFLTVASIILLYILRGNKFIKLLISAILEYKELVRLFIQTCKELHEYYLTTLVGSFGWLDANVSSIFKVAFFSTLTYIFISDTDIEKEKAIRTRDRVIIVFLCIIMFTLILISMFSWSFYVYGLDIYAPISSVRESIRSLHRFDGVQSRYFIPFLPLFCIAFKSSGLKKNKTKLIYDILFYVISEIYVFSILINRYWA